MKILLYFLKDTASDFIVNMVVIFLFVFYYFVVPDYWFLSSLLTIVAVGTVRIFSLKKTDQPRQPISSSITTQFSCNVLTRRSRVLSECVSTSSNMMMISFLRCARQWRARLAFASQRLIIAFFSSSWRESELPMAS